MKAVVHERYGSPEVLSVRDVPLRTPGPRELSVEVHATSVTSGDARVRALDVPAGFGLFARLAFGLRRPRQKILGIELAGVVTAVGSAVTRFAVGDRIFGMSGTRMGCHAEHCVVAEDAALAEVPAGLDFERAAALAFGGTTALSYLRRGGVVAGERVLVNGASGCVGTMTVQLAKHFGAHVTGVTSARNAELVRSLGADEVIDYAQEDFTQRRAAYDVIVDTVGTLSFARGRAALREGGRLGLVVADLVDMLAIPWAAATTTKRVVAGPAPERAEDVRTLAELASQGALRPVIDRRYALDEVAQAHAYVDSKRKRGAVIVRVRDEAGVSATGCP